MIRSSLGDHKYWDDAYDYAEKRLVSMRHQITDPSGDQNYRPQYIFEFAKNNWHQILRRYSRGDAISELPSYFEPLIQSWEESERLGANVWTAEQKRRRRSWKLNLDHYIVCFWLVGLALALNIPEDQWHRLLTLIGNEGQDELLDRIIASRSPSRKIGQILCHPKPYQRLLDAINAPQPEQPQLLADFVKHWYKELNRPPKKGLSEQTAMYDRPYWYTYGNKGLHDSGYFGRWCVEAVAAVKAFHLDDRLCLGHEHYPGDLLRPNEPSTHIERNNRVSAGDTKFEYPTERQTPPRMNWFAGLFSKK
jgi:Domain of unknown function (DUF1911)/Domain of unknown function (DUF1910)